MVLVDVTIYCSDDNSHRKFALLEVEVGLVPVCLGDCVYFDSLEWV